jgi:hypothetical protein
MPGAVDEELELRRPLADGALAVVARGDTKDSVAVPICDLVPLLLLP